MPIDQGKAGLEPVAAGMRHVSRRAAVASMVSGRSMRKRAVLALPASPPLLQNAQVRPACSPPSLPARDAADAAARASRAGKQQ